MTTYVQDIEFALSEALRFSKMELSELENLPFEDPFATLPHVSGSGDIVYGSKAERRLQDIAGVAVSRSTHAGRLDTNEVLRHLKSVIVERFIGERRALIPKEAARAVSSAIKLAAKSIVDLTHIVPCHLVYEGSPDVFSIGPVKFSRREQRMAQLHPAFQAFCGSSQEKLADEEDDQSFRGWHLAGVQSYFDYFDWVAEVTVLNCDRKTSSNRAEYVIQGALNCLHLLVGAALSHRMRIGGPSYEEDRRGRIVVNPEGDIGLATSTSWHGHRLGEGWWDLINSKGGDEIVTLMGITLDRSCSFASPPPLVQRFLDGISWYGEAVRDQFSASRLVKYVTAIERIVTTKNVDDLSELIARRGSALLAYGSGGRRDDEKTLREVYDMRSRLVHGSISPHRADLGVALRDAEEISRYILLSSLRFFGESGLCEPAVSRKNLDENYDRLIFLSSERLTENDVP